MRAAALAKLAVQPGDTLWDVGAGTGSVSVEHIDDRRVNGTINTNATALGAAALANDVEILDTTSEGVAGTDVYKRQA